MSGVAVTEMCSVEALLQKLEAEEVPIVEAVSQLRFHFHAVTQSASLITQNQLLNTVLEEDVRKSLQLLAGTDSRKRSYDLPVHSGAESNRSSCDISQATRQQLMMAESEWQWDPETLLDTRVLSVLAMHLFEASNLISHFGLDTRRLDKFFQTIERGYSTKLPYHNNLHAAAVLQKTHMMLSSDGVLPCLADSFAEQQVIKLSLYLAAIIHDFRHPGVTNAFLIRVADPLAIRHNDQSPLENHHLSAAFEVLNQGDKNILRDLPQDVRTTVRKHMIDAVQGTDMQKHFDILQTFVVKAQAQTLKWSMQLLLKCADLAHTTSSLSVHQRWVKRLEEELFLQGDREKRMNLTVSPLMNRDHRGITASQVDFFKVFVLPMFERSSAVFPKTNIMLEVARSNHSFWGTSIKSRT